MPAIASKRVKAPREGNLGDSVAVMSRGCWDMRDRWNRIVPPKSRVGDWRAGLGRSLCSLFPRPFGCEVSQHRDHAYVSSPRRVERSVRISRLYAHLPASPQGLWDLSCWGDFRLQPFNLVAVEQLQGVV
jgi:hypothetical protein